MAEREKLPYPATQQDAYLHAIAAEVRDLNDRLEQLIAALMPSPPPDTDGAAVDIREPATQRKPRTREEMRARAG